MGRDPGAVTIEAVAALSGVAKTTIYRRHRHRDDMLRAAIEQVTKVPLPAPEMPTREKVRWVLNEFRNDIEHVLGLGTIAAILTDANPQFTNLYRGMLSPYNDMLIDLIDSAVDAGDLRPDLDSDAALNLILGSYLAEHLRHGHIRDDGSTVRWPQSGRASRQAETNSCPAFPEIAATGPPRRRLLGCPAGDSPRPASEQTRRKDAPAGPWSARWRALKLQRRPIEPDTSGSQGSSVSAAMRWSRAAATSSGQGAVRRVSMSMWRKISSITKLSRWCESSSR